MTERQQKILMAIIREFMKSAVPVGSMNVVSNYPLDVSPATVRNEMVELSDLGYLSKSHISSGRIPTDLGLRYFVQELMEEDSTPNLDAVKFRMQIFNKRFEEEKMIRRVLAYLSDETGYAALCLMSDVLRYHGLSSLTDYEELRSLDVLNAVLYLLENSERIRKVFEKSATDDVCAIIGGESGISDLQNCAFVFSGLKYLGGRTGYIGVLGPRRMRYGRVIPVIRMVRDAIESSVKGW